MKIFYLLLIMILALCSLSIAYNPGELAYGVVASYSFEEPDIYADSVDAEAKLNLSLGSGSYTNLTTGHLGKSVFIASAGQFTTNESSLFGFSTLDFTISLWINTTQAMSGNYPYPIHFATNGYTITAGYDMDEYNVRVGWNTWTDCNTNSSKITIKDGLWHNIIVTRNAGYVYCYVDGVNVGIGEDANDFGTADILHIGRDGAAGSIYQGGIDEINIWNRTLNSSELSQIYTTSSYYPWQEVANIAPEISQPSLGDETIYNTTDINCSVYVYDANLNLTTLYFNVSVNNVFVAQQISYNNTNGSLVNWIIGRGNYSVGQNVSCWAKATDGKDSSIRKQTSVVILGFVAPYAPSTTSESLWQGILFVVWLVMLILAIWLISMGFRNGSIIIVLLGAMLGFIVVYKIPQGITTMFNNDAVIRGILAVFFLALLLLMLKKNKGSGA